MHSEHEKIAISVDTTQRLRVFTLWIKLQTTRI